MAKHGYEFAIKKDVLNSGKTIYTPICRKKSHFPLLSIFNNPWGRITKIYDQYTLMELNFVPDLSYKECEIHIKGYQEVLAKSVEHQIATAEFHLLEGKKV